LDDGADLELGRPVTGDVVEELLADFLTNDEDGVVKSGCHRILRGVVHEGLASRSYRCELLQPTETPTVTCCHDDELHGENCTVPPAAFVSFMVDIPGPRVVRGIETRRRSMCAPCSPG
jgi:hypothetical protein